jgi:anti-sigma factor RsiW
MKCEEVQEQLVLLAYGELGEDEQADVELHLHGCPECTGELNGVLLLREQMAQEMLPEVSPNLLAASRMRLDEALDEAGTGTWAMRLRAQLVGTWRHLYAAPALATFLMGAGFLGGTWLAQYQARVASADAPQKSIVLSDQAHSRVGAVRSIVQDPASGRVEVAYDRVVPETYQGSMNEPQLRQLMMIAAKQTEDSQIRAQSVSFVADECKAGRRCEHTGAGEGGGFRDELLQVLRYDKSPMVRMTALEGLKPYVAEDRAVRDALLESLSHDRDANVRTHAIHMLEPVEGDSSVRQVLQTVSTQDENPNIRNVSMQVLGAGNGLQ